MKKGSSHIVSEAFGFGNTFNSFANHFIKVLRNVFKSKEFINEFNDYFISKKLFKWDSVLKSKPKITKEQQGSRSILGFTYSKELSPEEAKRLIFGGKNEEKEPGLIWNTEFNKIFESLDISKPDVAEFDESISPILKIYKNILSEEIDDGDEEELVDPDENEKSKLIENFKIELYIEMNDFELTDSLKEDRNKLKNIYNPDYITKINGAMTIFFYKGKKREGTEPEITQKFIFFPKRTEDMEPKKSILSKISDIAVGRLTDSQGIIPQNGVIQAMIGRMTNSAKSVLSGKLKVIQYEHFEIDFRDAYSKTNISYGNRKNYRQNITNNPKEDILESDKIIKIIDVFNKDIPTQYEIKFRERKDESYIDVWYNKELLFTIVGRKDV